MAVKANKNPVARSIKQDVLVDLASTKLRQNPQFSLIFYNRFRELRECMLNETY